LKVLEALGFVVGVSAALFVICWGAFVGVMWVVEQLGASLGRAVRALHPRR
jgi:hypothetical protein